jgi:ligand-binding sensor domain-containing protein
MRSQREEDEDGLTARIIKADIFDNNRLWLGTDRGTFFSLNKGQTWEKLYLGGIDNLFVNSLAQTTLEKDTFYIGARQGFFVVNYKKNTTRELFEGLYSSNIEWVAFSPQGRLYLATLKGLFEGDYFTPSHQNKEIAVLLHKEPSIGEIQQAALRYNEVHPDKIRKWRNALRFRALLPEVSLDYDKTINYDSGADQYYIGPRDWGVSFSWDVADLIWDTHQDDIDTRSRLNTQLRLDIIDEINRVYFERLRLKHMIVSASLNEEEKFEKELRLRELTAILDGYTGGYFSKKAKELNETQ